MRAQEEVSANVVAAEDTAIDNDGEVQTSNLRSAFALQNSGFRYTNNLVAQ